jgi:hypothetical protein
MSSLSCCDKPTAHADGKCDNEAPLLHELAMKGEIAALKQQLKEMTEAKDKPWHEKIDAFVDQWFEANQEQVDLGRFTIFGYEFDVLSDSIEKHIYKRVFKIMYSLVTSRLDVVTSHEEVSKGQEGKEEKEESGDDVVEELKVDLEL